MSDVVDKLEDVSDGSDGVVASESGVGRAAESCDDLNDEEDVRDKFEDPESVPS